MIIPRAKKLSSSNWFIHLRLGGENISVTESTEKKCIAEARRVKAEYLAGKREPIQNDSRTLHEILDDYISSRENTLSPASIRAYTKVRDLHFASYSDIKIQDIKSWQEVCDKESAKYAAKTVKSAWGLVRSALKYAGQPIPTVTLPQIVAKKRPYLDSDQIAVFVKAVSNEPIQIPALLALHGLRCSEIFALTWDKSINLKDKTIFVSGAMVYNKDGKFVSKKENKNTSSQRTVPIMIDELLKALSVCKKKKGAVVNTTPKMLYDGINKVCRKNGLPTVGIHGLRHAFASLCYHLNVPHVVAAKLGGWSDLKTMHNIYTHISEKDIMRHTSAMTNFFNQPDTES